MIKEFVFYFIIALSIAIFIKLGNRVSLLNRIIIAISAVIILSLLFVFISVVVALVVLFIVIFMLLAFLSGSFIGFRKIRLKR